MGYSINFSILDMVYILGFMVFYLFLFYKKVGKVLVVIFFLFFGKRIILLSKVKEERMVLMW